MQRTVATIAFMQAVLRTLLAILVLLSVVGCVVEEETDPHKDLAKDATRAEKKASCRVV